MRGYVWNRNFGIQLVERSESLNIHIFNPTIVTKLIGNSILTNVCKQTPGRGGKNFCHIESVINTRLVTCTKTGQKNQNKHNIRHLPANLVLNFV